jgi:acetyltransferase-like isoleucine patch superfamily enzyme
MPQHKESMVITMTEEEKIMAGVLFSPADPELKKIKLRTHNLNLDYNRTYEDEVEKRQELIRQIVGEIGPGGFMQGPIFFHYGVHTRIGKNFFANFNLTVQDDAAVTIGDHCNFGPNITIVTPIHPMLPNERDEIRDKDGNIKRLCYAKPVHIGNHCWLGANVVVCSGVTIGDGCVIGAGSVVVKDIPPNSFAAGNPCTVIREITEKDSMKYKPEILADNQVIE